MLFIYKLVCNSCSIYGNIQSKFAWNKLKSAALAISYYFVRYFSLNRDDKMN